MTTNRSLALLLAGALLLVLLALLLVGGSLAWLDAEGAELPVVYRTTLTCPEHRFLVYGATEHTWTRTVYTGRPAGDPACNFAGICFSLWEVVPAGESWLVPMYQPDGLVTRRNLAVEIEDWNNAPLTVAVWPAQPCGSRVWLPAVTR